MRTYVLLPVTKEVFDFIAQQIEARGQPDRVQDGRIDLSDVHLELNEERVLKVDTACPTCKGKKTVKQWYDDDVLMNRRRILVPCPTCKGKGRVK
jgi:hypothetical protein